MFNIGDRVIHKNETLGFIVEVDYPLYRIRAQGPWVHFINLKLFHSGIRVKTVFMRS